MVPTQLRPKGLPPAEGGDDNVPEGEQVEGDRGSGQDTTTPQGQEGPHGAPKVEGAKMETEAQDEPQPSDHESEISTPCSEQSSIKSDEERMVGLEEVTAATGDMTLETPRTRRCHHTKMRTQGLKMSPSDKGPPCGPN